MIRFFFSFDKSLCQNPGLNQGPLDLQSNALPTELFRPTKVAGQISAKGTYIFGYMETGLPIMIGIGGANAQLLLFFLVFASEQVRILMEA